MSKQTPEAVPRQANRLDRAERLSLAELYGEMRHVWVDDGHVFIEEQDGKIVSMTPEVAIELGRLLAKAGTESLINKVVDKASEMPRPS